MEDIIEVKKYHQINSAKYRYNPQECTQLSAIVNPIILKLTKEDDSEGMGKFGPMYSGPPLSIDFFPCIILYTSLIVVFFLNKSVVVE